MSHCTEEDVQMNNRHTRQWLTLVIRKMQIQEHEVLLYKHKVMSRLKKIKPRQYQCLMRICSNWYNLSENGLAMLLKVVILHSMTLQFHI